MPDAIDASLIAPEKIRVVKMTGVESAALARCGIESLQIASPPTGILTAPHYGAISIDNGEDCWVRDVTMKDSLNDVLVGGRARRVTIEGVNAYHTAWPALAPALKSAVLAVIESAKK